MHVELWTRTEGRADGVVAATVRSEAGELSIQELEPLGSKVKAHIEWLHQLNKQRSGDDKAFLTLMTVDFSGSYWWAVLKD